jgi:ABC-type multidrug transport system fused ATPase/permease subunit
MTIFPEPISLRSPRFAVVAPLVLILAGVPLIVAVLDVPFYMTLALRILIFGLAATSLNLVLGYGGLVSFGHALYLGLGAYAVAILSFHGVINGWLHLGAAVILSAVTSLLTGLICLRTSGIAFIMITLAFTQMFFYLATSLKYYGGDDGLPVSQRSDFYPLFSIQSNTGLYYLTLATVLVSLYMSWRFVHSRFGRVLRGSRSNARRMNALGFPSFALPADGICGLELPVRSGRLSPGKSDALCIAGLHGLDGIGRLDSHHHHRRCGDYPGPPGRRDYLRHSRNCDRGLYTALDDRAGADHRVRCAFCAAGRVRFIHRLGKALEAVAMTASALTTHGLTKRLGANVVSDSIDLDIAQGEVHAIIGPNGAGKTTLINQLIGELKPDAGRIEFFGRDVTHLPDALCSVCPAPIRSARCFRIFAPSKTSRWPHKRTTATVLVVGNRPLRIST